MVLSREELVRRHAAELKALIEKGERRKEALLIKQKIELETWDLRKGQKLKAAPKVASEREFLEVWRFFLESHQVPGWKEMEWEKHWRRVDVMAKNVVRDIQEHLPHWKAKQILNMACKLTGEGLVTFERGKPTLVIPPREVCWPRLENFEKGLSEEADRE